MQGLDTPLLALSGSEAIPSHQGPSVLEWALVHLLAHALLPAPFPSLCFPLPNMMPG